MVFFIYLLIRISTEGVRISIKLDVSLIAKKNIELIDADKSIVKEGRERTNERDSARCPFTSVWPLLLDNKLVDPWEMKQSAAVQEKKEKLVLSFRFAELIRLVTSFSISILQMSSSLPNSVMLFHIVEDILFSHSNVMNWQAGRQTSTRFLLMSLCAHACDYHPIGIWTMFFCFALSIVYQW